jgi:hypothetical protein
VTDTDLRRLISADQRRTGGPQGVLVGQADHEDRGGIDEVPGGAGIAGAQQEIGQPPIGLVDREIAAAVVAGEPGKIIAVDWGPDHVEDELD